MAQQISEAPESKRRRKLSQLPSNAKVHKRPLLRPPLASPYSGHQQAKIVYISSSTPFLSAVKRCEKLLRLADKRNVQSATTLVTQRNNKRRRHGDELLEIAETLEADKQQQKLKGSPREEVVFKGTGKAIQKVLELALWFQQRDEYDVHLNTGTVGAIDDISVKDEDAVAGDEVGSASADVPETRIRYTSVLEVAVSLR